MVISLTCFFIWIIIWVIDDLRYSRDEYGAHPSFLLITVSLNYLPVEEYRDVRIELQARGAKFVDTGDKSGHFTAHSG
jgi:hypothetical protein